MIERRHYLGVLEEAFYSRPEKDRYRQYRKRPVES
jgi:hypothetical protein